MVMIRGSGFSSSAFFTRLLVSATSGWDCEYLKSGFSKLVNLSRMGKR